jgi:hypothetical protein
MRRAWIATNMRDNNDRVGLKEIESWKAWSSAGQRLGRIVWLGGFITSWHYFTNECAPVAQPDRATDF